MGVILVHIKLFHNYSSDVTKDKFTQLLISVVLLNNEDFRPNSVTTDISVDRFSRSLTDDIRFCDSSGQTRAKCQHSLDFGRNGLFGHRNDRLCNSQTSTQTHRWTHKLNVFNRLNKRWIT